MKLLDDSGLQLTRRHFFGRSATGIGVAALASLLGQDLRAENSPAESAWRAARAAAFRAESQARHLPVSIRRSVADGTVRLQAAPHGVPGHRICRNRCARASGSPACRPRSRASRWCRRTSSSRSMANPARGSASCCRTPRKVADELTFIKSAAHRSHQSRSGGHVHADRRANRGPAQHGRVGGLRPRQRNRRPARRSW